MLDTALAQLASGVAVELTKRDGRQWAAFPGEGKRGFGVDIRSADLTP